MLRSKPLAKPKLNMIATPMVITGMQVDIIPVPIPLIITVAEPVRPASEIFCVGLYEWEV